MHAIRHIIRFCRLHQHIRSNDQLSSAGRSAVKCVSLHPVIDAHSSEPTCDLWSVIKDKPIWRTMARNHCNGCNIRPQMNRDIGETMAVEALKGNVRSNRSAHCDISLFNLPGVSLNGACTSFRTCLDMNSSHSSDLSPNTTVKRRTSRTISGCLVCNMLHTM